MLLAAPPAGAYRPVRLDEQVQRWPVSPEWWLPHGMAQSGGSTTLLSTEMAFPVIRRVKVSGLAVYVTVAAGGATVELGLREPRYGSAYPRWLVPGSVVSVDASTTGWKEAVIDVLLAPGVYHAVANPEGAAVALGSAQSLPGAWGLSPMTPYVSPTGSAAGADAQDAAGMTPGGATSAPFAQMAVTTSWPSRPFAVGLKVSEP